MANRKSTNSAQNTTFEINDKTLPLKLTILQHESN